MGTPIRQPGVITTMRVAWVGTASPKIARNPALTTPEANGWASCAVLRRQEGLLTLRIILAGRGLSGCDDLAASSGTGHRGGDRGSSARAGRDRLPCVGHLAGRHVEPKD